MSLAVSLSSCGAITRSAADAAKNWWEDNKTEVIASTAKAATTYWEENKEEIITQVLDVTEDYVDQKLQSRKEETVKRLLDKGYEREEIDTNGDGEITDDELAEFLKANPMALWATGLGGVLFLGLWYLKQMRDKKESEKKEPAKQPTS